MDWNSPQLENFLEGLPFSWDQNGRSQPYLEDTVFCFQISGAIDNLGGWRGRRQSPESHGCFWVNVHCSLQSECKVLYKIPYTCCFIRGRLSSIQSGFCPSAPERMRGGLLTRFSNPTDWHKIDPWRGRKRIPRDEYLALVAVSSCLAKMDFTLSFLMLPH